MSKYWSNKTQSIKPYVPGEQPKEKDIIKINTNENPYPPSQKVYEAISQFDVEKLRLYPDMDCRSFRNILAQTYDLHENNIFVGNGSDEVLAFAFQAFYNPGDMVLIPEISYSFYPIYCQVNQIEFLKIPLNQDFSIPIEEFCGKNKGIIIANPNAPTGIYLELCDIEKIVVSNEDKVVIIDEAYIDFGGESAVKLVKKYKNLLVIHTMSKSKSLAGLRVGYAFGDNEIIEGLDRVKNSFNSYTVDAIAMSSAQAAILDNEYYENISKSVIKTRESFVKGLERLGFRTLPSKANFVFTTHESVQAELIFNELRKRNILVRYFKTPGIDNFLRITIGTDDNMERVLYAIKDII